MTENRKTPKLRFKGFTDAWEQRKLSEMSSLITKGTTPLDKSNTGNVNFIKIESIDEASGEITITKKITNEEHEGYLRRSQLKENDILFSIAGTLGRVTSVKSSILPANTNQALAIIRRKSGDLQYVKTYLKGKVVSDYIKKNPTIGAQPNLSLEQVGNLEIALPILDEQKKIGKYFSELDNLITLHQRKLDRLKNIKKSMLDKMFPKDGEVVPEIRFKGFTDAWEQRKLGEVVDRVVRKNINNESTLPLTISAQYGLVDQVTYFNNRVASRDVSNYYLVLNGEFAYNKSTSDGFPFGTVKRLDLYKKGVLSTLYIVFNIKGKAKTNSDFLTVFFDTDRWHKCVSERAAEGARNHGLLNISAEDFFDIDLCLPKSEEEQAVIGAYFRSLDHLITLHQRKLDKLKNIKKSMLDNMFV